MEIFKKRKFDSVFSSGKGWKQLLRGILFSWMILSGLSMFAQNTRTITGKVVAEDGETLPGVNVVLKNTTNGTTTDADGNFTLTIPGGEQMLVFTYLGMETQELSVTGTGPVRVVMKESSQLLDEVVVVGYGVVKKRDLTGAIVQVKSEQLMATAPTTVQNALRGKAAGVMVAGGGLNSDPTIRIRGNRSISATNDPLFVIDGIPSSGGVNNINPSDIASIEVLKDASATAIYGSRGANGVILVTTKQGESGKVNVEYNSYLSIGKIDRYHRVRTGEEYLEYLREADRKYIYDGQGGYTIDPNCVYPSETPSWEYDQRLEYIASRDLSGYVLESVRRAWANGAYQPSLLRTFDWQGAGFRDEAISQNHNFSIRGGTKDTKVFLSGSLMDNEGITPQSYRTRYTLRLTLEQSLGKMITMGGTTNFAYVESYGGTGVGGNWNPLGTPYYSPGGSGDFGVGGDVTRDGDPALGLVPHPTGEGMLWNPFFDFTGNIGRTKNNQIDATVYAILKFDFGLSYRANFGTNYSSGQTQAFYSAASTQQGFGNSRANQDLSFSRRWTFENILNYSKTFREHSLNLTFVQSTEKSVSEPVTASAVDLPLEMQLYYNLGAASTQAVTSGYTQWTMASWMGRFIYGFRDNRYMLTASLRYDGSSRLAKGNKWVAFPSFSLAYRLSDESFFKDYMTVINNLKLRIGYGKTGNSSVNPYQTVGTISSARYILGETGALGYGPNSLSNSALTWETTGQYNIGLDFGTLKGRISGTLELYKQNTYDLLMPRALPEVSGFGSIVQNIGETENKGLEVTLETVNFQQKNFKWNTSLQFATNREQIVRQASGLEQDIANGWFNGYPIRTHYGYVRTKYVWGYTKEDMEEMAKYRAAGGRAYIPGDLRFEDLNGDYRIDATNDRKILGQRMPKWTAGMGNSLSYKNFDFYVFSYGMFGHTVYSDPGYGHDGRMNTRYGEYWTPRNTKSDIRKPQKGDSDQPNREAYWYYKGNFVRISDITLGYTLPNSLTSRISVQKLRFYVQLQNPFLITKYPNSDPEGPVTGTGSEGGSSTTLKYYMFGLNLTL